MLTFVTVVAFLAVAAAAYACGFIHGVVKATPDIREVTEEEIIEAFGKDEDEFPN